MIRQGILPFKLEKTEAELTSRSGLAVCAEVWRALGVEADIGRMFPAPGSNRGYAAWSYVEPLLLMLTGGGRHIEDLREIRDDKALRRVLGLEKMPSLSTFGDWLWRQGQGEGIDSMEEVNRRLARKILSRDRKGFYTLDVDATVIEADKREAKWTYKHVKGYQPILGYIAENGLCVGYEFREGNVPAQADAVAFIKTCQRSMPQGREIDYLRSDSAFYQADVINWCYDNEKKFTITADKDAAVVAALQTIRDWKPLCDRKGEATDREVGTAIHIMRDTPRPFLLIVQRWLNPQRDLFASKEFCYHAIATNWDEMTPEETVHLHNKRGQAENLIKELKIGFGMEQMPSGKERANALFFGIGVLAYNATLAQKRLLMGKQWRKTTISTLRWRLIQIAGRVVRHGRGMILKLATTQEKLAILAQIRANCLEFR